MSSYATPQDYVEWTGKAAPADIVPRLRRASSNVDSELLAEIYDITDPYVALALNQATCEQADYVRGLGNSGGQPTGIVKAKIGSVDIQRGGSGTLDPTLGGTQTPFSPVAFTILQTAGMLNGTPPRMTRPAGIPEIIR